ncbi:hypothetical protein GHI93_03190 [Lactococcus hircilactis]|uniref:DUF218 domain-containing protein n=1 Tax=Lactococcus hircilactis TaxID=1494462 RepID=A0A7X1Z904_9LACT|nr:hypothetical protein [Lactococcus hircilactis]
MTDQGIFYFFLFFSFIFLGATFLFYWKIKKIPDLRTLKLGRLGFGFLLSLFFLLNSLIASAVAFQFSEYPTLLTRIGIIALVVEGILIFIFPLIFGFALPIAILILTVKMWRRESKSIANLILPIIMFLFFILDWISLYVGRLSDQWIWLKILSFAYPILSLYLSWQFLVFFLSSWIYGRKMKKTTATYYVVLGAGLVQGDKVGVLLGNRIRAAVNAATEKTILVFSGGQGKDEHLSEAQAMQKFAVETLNFPIERTLLEDQSKTTYENLVFSSKIIDEKSAETSFLFFTSDYHVFRAALFARQLNLGAQGGKGGKTAFYYRVPAFIREFIAVMNNERKKHMIWVGSIVGGLGLIAVIVELIQHLRGT